MEKLLEGVQRVGEGDYHFNVNLKTRNEIGVLAASFNSMVNRIKEQKHFDEKRTSDQRRVRDYKKTPLLGRRNYKDVQVRSLTLK